MHAVVYINIYSQSVQFLSCLQLFATPWTAACQTSLSITNFQSLFKLMSIEPLMSSNHLIPWSPLLLLPSRFPSIRVFSNELVLHLRWPEYWNFSFSISPSMNIQDWFPLGLTGWISLQSKDSQESSSTLQFISILHCSAFFIVQLSHPYMTTGETIALTRWNFVGKIISLLLFFLILFLFNLIYFFSLFYFTQKGILFFLMCCLGWS